jgi:plastocyanin
MRTLRMLVLGALATLGLVHASAAQTTHTVTLNGFSFSPANLQIDLGDKVHWVKTIGLHSVESGTGGVHDGAFRSGDVTASAFTFDVTFDSAFLAANPMVGSVYPYYCANHVGFGMIGSVAVDIPASATTRNGNGVNPSAYTSTSLPVLGTSWTAEIDLSSVSSTGLAFVLGYEGPLPPIPLSFGELLVDITTPNLLALSAAGPNTLRSFSVVVPNDIDLNGFPVYTQGLAFGPLKLTNAVDLVLGF